jgi:hypothetical protein
MRSVRYEAIAEIGDDAVRKLDRIGIALTPREELEALKMKILQLELALESAKKEMDKRPIFIDIENLEINP